MALVENGLASSQEILEAALLQLEPAHDGSLAIQILKTLPPEQRMRDVWLAFAYTYEILDQNALNEAIGICTEIRRKSLDADVHGAALMLRASALRQLGGRAEARADAEGSTKIAPHWVGNRQLLAQLLLECGDPTAAREQLKRALANAVAIPRPKGYADYVFERLITARLSDGIAKRLRHQLGE